MDNKGISNAVIKRLPRYYRYLDELLESGVERISSGELSRRMNVTASQIRQDLNNFGGFGQQGYGYHVEYLYKEIGKILGLNRENRMIVIGAGNLGNALANYGNFGKRGFVIVGMFDQKEELVGKELQCGIRVRHIDELESFLSENSVRIATLAIPKTHAPQIAERLVACGIKAIWNFAHTDLQVPRGVVVENVHLSESLMQLSYRYSSMYPEDDAE